MKLSRFGYEINVFVATAKQGATWLIRNSAFKTAVYALHERLYREMNVKTFLMYNLVENSRSINIYVFLNHKYRCF